MSPSTYQAPHEVRDEEKLTAMVETLRSGGSLPPIVVEPNGQVAISGSHRLAAWRKAEMEPVALVLSDEDYAAACEYMGVDYFDEAVDHETVCRAVYETTSDSAIRTALEDQV